MPLAVGSRTHVAFALDVAVAEDVLRGEKDVVRMYIGELVRCALTSCSADSRRSARACSCTARSVRRG